MRLTLSSSVISHFPFDPQAEWVQDMAQDMALQDMALQDRSSTNTINSKPNRGWAAPTVVCPLSATEF